VWIAAISGPTGTAASRTASGPMPAPITRASCSIACHKRRVHASFASLRPARIRADFSASVSDQNTRRSISEMLPRTSASSRPSCPTIPACSSASSRSADSRVDFAASATNAAARGSPCSPGCSALTRTRSSCGDGTPGNVAANTDCSRRTAASSSARGATTARCSTSPSAVITGSFAVCSSPAIPSASTTP
jgi:hypothetical protein